MTEVVNTASAFSITELSGEERAVVLVDRALPYRPFEFTTKQRIELTWYPGNPEATATVLGSQEMPSTANGMWKDKYLSRTVPVTTTLVSGQETNQLTPISLNGERVNTAREAVELFDSIVRQGQLVEVTWFNQTRHGLITSFRKRWQNTHDVEWEMEFEWISRGEPTQPAVFTEETSVGSTADQLRQQNKNLQNASVFRFSVASTRQAQVILALNAVNAAVTAIANANTNYNQQANTPADATRRTVALCNGIATATDALISVLSETPWFALNAVVPIADLTFADRIEAYAYVSELISLARAMKRTAVEYRATLASQIDSQLLGIYTAREGDDLRIVSEQFYGTPFEWRRLMLFNLLDSAALAQGTLVLVPRVLRADNVMV